MKIYFACSITGGRQDEDIYSYIIGVLHADGYDVPSAVFALPHGVDEHEMKAPQVYQRDTQWIRESDVLIAEVSTPSHGVGYEIGFALNLEKPVLCLHRQDFKISKMISGNPHPKLQIEQYTDQEELKEILGTFLDQNRMLK